MKSSFKIVTLTQSQILIDRNPIRLPLIGFTIFFSLSISKGHLCYLFAYTMYVLMPYVALILINVS